MEILKFIRTYIGTVILTFFVLVCFFGIRGIIKERTDKIECYEIYIKDKVIITKCQKYFDEVNEKES